MNQEKIYQQERGLSMKNPNAPDGPEPDTDFQKFVLAATGARLKIFGSELFKNVPSTFSPVDQVPVSSDYVIGPGDEVVLRGWGQIDINYHATVDRLGKIFIPKVGEVYVAGTKFGQLQPLLKTAIERVFRNFELNVTLGQLRSIQIFVVGQAKRPGAYTVSSLSTLVNAIFASGGPSLKGSLRHIQLKRGNEVISDFDLYDLILAGDKSRDATLLPGDVIYIPPVGPLAAILGGVNVPAIYEIKDKSTLKDLMEFAGGLTPSAFGGKVTIESISSHSTRTVNEFPLDGAGLASEIKNGDLVTVKSLSAQFENAITLRGNVATPGRFSWHPGIRIRDIIPNHQALITRNYWRRQEQLGIDPEIEAEITNRPLKSDRRRSNNQVSNGDISESSGLEHPAPSMPPGNIQSSTNDQAYGADAGGSSSQNGQKLDESLRGEAGLRNDVRRSSPEINWDYAVIERLNKKELSTNLIPFNLGNAISDDNDPNNLALEPGDVITIFSQADIRVSEAKQSKFVRLEGEFKTAGVYEALPGETLRSLVLRVGGLTENAYLYGSEFTRESARRVQAKRFKEFLDRLEQEVERTNSVKSQNVISTEEAAGLQQRADTQRRLVDKLRNIAPTGRVVLEIKPWDNDISSLPDIPLEDGDRFFIPYQPAFVSVIGAVYNENSFLYKSTKSISSYLNEAGGGTRDADKERVFVVKADGSVISKNRSYNWFSGGWGGMHLSPGDTVVLPEQLDKVSVLKGLRDWSQVISQFALGVAAIRSITRP